MIKIGDIVIRKKEYRESNGWQLGDKSLTVENVISLMKHIVIGAIFWSLILTYFFGGIWGLAFLGMATFSITTNDDPNDYTHEGGI